MKEEFEDTLRQQLEDFKSEQIPEGLWEGIEQKLEAPKVVPMWKRWTAVAASILLIVGIGIGLYAHLYEDETQQMAVNNTIHHTDDNDMDEDNGAKEGCNGNAVLPNTQHLLADNVCHKNSYAREYADKESHSAVSALSQDEASINEGNDNENKNLADYNKQESGIKQKEGNRYARQDNMARKTTESHAKRVAVRLYASRMPNGGDNNMNGYMALSCAGMPDGQPQGMLRAPLAGTMESLFFANANKDEEPITNTTYAQPVGVGVSVGYELSERWGINVGVAYSRLKSTLKSGTEHSYFTNDQCLNYIGLPVNISYHFINKKNLRVYTSAGGMAEFGAGGDVDVVMVTHHKIVSHEKNEIHNLPVQFSVNASAGVEYAFYHALGLFVEPGVSYHFKDNSDISSIYKAHPLNFNMQMGLRWIINK